jgi:hypothetical protein
LSKDPESRPSEILVHVDISASNDPPQFTYSHSFKYRVPSGIGEIVDKTTASCDIVVYCGKTAASGDTYSFDLERKCRDEECKIKNKNGCPIIISNTNRVLVADIFHTKPTENALHEFGTALFKALFSGYAGQLLYETEPTYPNGQIFLQLNKHDDLDAIPWEYAKNGPTFLAYQRQFSRLHRQRELQLLKLPLHIVAVVLDPIIPLDDPNIHLENLYLKEQFQNFIDEHSHNNKKVTLERVFPPTTNQMDKLLMKEPKTATVLHFMGYCVSEKDQRVLVFEDDKTGEHAFIDALHLLAFLSACNTCEIARVLLEQGVPYTIGSYCPLPDDLAHKFECKFYQLLASGFPIEMAMWKARVFLNNQKDVHQSYFPGAMILYLSTFRENDGIFECEEGKPLVKLHMPPNNLELIPPALKFIGHKSELVKLNSVLKDMVDHNEQVHQIYTVTGIGGQGKTALAMEAVSRMTHLFPGGIFAWPFDCKEISVAEYLQQLSNVIFPEDVQLKLNYQNDEDTQQMGQAIIKTFTAYPSCLLILDHADTLNLAKSQGKKEAVELVAWLQKLISTQGISVKILATSFEDLNWPNEEKLLLNGFVDVDIHSGCELFYNNLSIMAKNVSKHLLQELVMQVDGHPLSLILLGHAAKRKQNSDKQLEDIIKHYCMILADEEKESRELRKHFGIMFETITPKEQLFFSMCSSFIGPITLHALLLISCLIDNREMSKNFNEDVVKNYLEQGCHHGLLSKKNEKYKIQVAFQEAMQQYNAKIKLQLYLQIPNLLNNFYIIGIPLENGELYI